jgi:hypothetical protein
MAPLFYMAPMPPQPRIGLHYQKRIAPSGKASTGTNAALPIRVVQTRLRAPALSQK